LLREKGGAAPDPAEFARQFPDFQASVLDMLDGHCLLVANPALLDAPAPEWPEIGAMLEGLELRAELGRGAFGRAYLAYDPAIRRLRALKLTPGGTAEAQLIGGLSHPHVIDVCWARRSDRRTTVCMPFVGSCTLADVIAGAGEMPESAQTILDAAAADENEVPLDTRSKPVVRANDSYLVGACAVAARIAAAVDYLHRNNVVHGDLKPSNVVIEPGGSPRLIDFNLAAGEESPTALRGTPAYMAPELLDATMSGGCAAEINGAKADLFALGVLLVELLTGRHPYRNEGNGTLAALASAARRGPPVLPDAIPPTVARMLGSCLAVNPADRPGSAASLAAELERIVYRARTRGRRRKRRVVACAALLLTGALAPFAIAAWPTPEPIIVPEAAPDSASEFFERGLRLLHDKRHAEAMPFFLDAIKRSDDPRYKAMAAYCYILNGQPRFAVEMSRQAIEQGSGTAEVHNNLGYALMRCAELTAAIAELDKAIQQAPNMQVAYYNRSLARFQLDMIKRTANSDVGSLEDIQAALTGPLETADLHLDAARIYSYYSAQNAKFLDAGFTQLELAVRAGRDPKTFGKDRLLKKYQSDEARFERLFSLPQTPAREDPVLAHFVVEPRF
jgi:eukaryotic-like serine/threonine-protein kinase